VHSKSPGINSYPAATFSVYSFFNTLTAISVIVIPIITRSANKAQSAPEHLVTPIIEAYPLPLSTVRIIREDIIIQFKGTLLIYR
jgi:hypothetical protein